MALYNCDYYDQEFCNTQFSLHPNLHFSKISRSLLGSIKNLFSGWHYFWWSIVCIHWTRSSLIKHCCGQDILHVIQMGCKTTNFGCFHGNTANKGFYTVQIDLQNAVVILVLCFATLQNKLATAVWWPDFCCIVIPLMAFPFVFWACYIITSTYMTVRKQERENQRTNLNCLRLDDSWEFDFLLLAWACGR